jgi:hypothetical protein
MKTLTQLKCSLVVLGILTAVSVQAQNQDQLRLSAEIPSVQIGAWSKSTQAPVECRGIKDIPGTYLCLTANAALLRGLMGRVSFYVEGKPTRTLMAATDPLYTNSNQANYAGHDIMAADMELFYQGLEKACPTKPTLCASPLESALRNVVMDDAHRKGFKNYAIIAAAVGTEYFSEVVSHEILHARYFLNPLYRAKVAQFWKTKVSAQDRKAITKIIGGIYNLTGQNGNDLLLNEFQAYTLQEAAMTSQLGMVYAFEHGQELRSYMGALLPPM